MTFILWGFSALALVWATFCAFGIFGWEDCTSDQPHRSYWSIFETWYFWAGVSFVLALAAYFLS